jgi:peptidoglycan/LPS O-acetylase OafA/YrhL
MYKSLQAGRAIAALLVVLFHLGGTIAAEKYFNIKEFSVPFSFGKSGVDFFFVLSGFIIYYAHKNDIGRPLILRTYIYKRIIRIYPAYIIIFFCVYTLAIITPQLRNTVPHDINILVQSLLLLPQDKNIVGGTGAPVLVVAWTLQFEILFYLLFSLGIINKRLGIVTILLFILLFLSSKIVSYDFPLSFFSSNYIWLFLMGMLCAKLTISKKSYLKHPNILAFTGVIIFITVAIDTIIANKLIEINTIIYGIGFSFIVISLVSYEKNGKIFLKNNFFQLLGSSSYALYLVHYPIISILCKVSLSLGLKQIGFLGALVAYVLIFFVCIISSILFHLFIEKPITKKLRSIIEKT